MRSTSAAGSIPASGLSIDGARTSSQRHGVICVGHRQPKLPPGTAPGLHPPGAQLERVFLHPNQPARRWLFSWSNVMAEKLSTVQKRENAGYQETPSTCSKCAHFQSEKELPTWMRVGNEKMVSLGRKPIYSIASSGIDRKLKCSIHGFSVKKMAVCSSFLDRG